MSQDHHDKKIESTSAVSKASSAAASHNTQAQNSKPSGSGTAVKPAAKDNPEDQVSLSSSASQKLQQLEQKQDYIYAAGDDKNNIITVSESDDGSIIVNIDGKEKKYSKEEAKKLVVQGGSGNDSISVDDNVDIGITIEGGAGDDSLEGGKGNDTISGGAGRDYIDGGAGNDNLKGEAGNDVIYGLDGNDTITGGDGDDYIDGGKGSDSIKGEAGKDDIFGGQGSDIIDGGDGDDVIAAGEGKDTIKGGAGKDHIYAQDEDSINSEQKLGLFSGLIDKIKHILHIKHDDPVTPPQDNSDTITTVDMSTTNAAGNEPGSTVTINGDDRFKDRTQSDLDALRSLPSGRNMLTELDDSGHLVDIKETVSGNSMMPHNIDDAYLVDPAEGSTTATQGPGTDSTINYNPSRVTLGSEAWMQRPPVVGLYHEMVHSYNAATGTMQPGVDKSSGSNNLERQAVGLSNSGLPFDHDQNPDTPAQVGNIAALTENGLRDELGLPLRPRY